MILETLRLVTNALNNATYGVNAQLDTLGLVAGDTAPPHVFTIVDETRDNQVAVGRYPTTLPALTVVLVDDVTMWGQVQSDIRDGTIAVLIRYVFTNVETAKGNSDVFYTLRAVEKTLTTFNSPDSESDRILNNIQIVSCDTIIHTHLFENIDDAYVTAGLKATFRVRDITP